MASTAGGSGGSECVKVAIRCRPMSTQEDLDGRLRVVDMDLKNMSVTVQKPPGAAGLHEGVTKTYGSGQKLKLLVRGLCHEYYPVHSS